jgi:hypothetical protein
MAWVLLLVQLPCFLAASVQLRRRENHEIHGLTSCGKTGRNMRHLFWILLILEYS